MSPLVKASILPGELQMIEGRLTILRRAKTSGRNRQVKELPACVSEKPYFAKTGWLKTGFDLLQYHVRSKRGYLITRMALENRMASYGHAMVATAGLLSAMDLPPQAQGYWTEHSERAVLPTGLSVLETPPIDKDILRRWKPEGYARSYGGGVARLQATFANTAKGENHYEDHDEREIASELKEWLVEKDKLDETMASRLTEEPSEEV